MKKLQHGMLLLLCYGRAAGQSPHGPNQTLSADQALLAASDSRLSAPEYPSLSPSETGTAAGTAGVVIKTISDEEVYEDSDLHLTRLIGASLVVLIISLGGLYLYHRITLEEEQNLEYTRPITTDDAFVFSTLDGFDPRASTA